MEAQEATNPNAMRAANAVSAWSRLKQKSVPAGVVILAASPRTLTSEGKGSGSHEGPAKESRVLQGGKIGEGTVDRGECKPNQLPFRVRETLEGKGGLRRIDCWELDCRDGAESIHI